MKKAPNLFDATVPERLKNTQVWFASIITRAIDINSHINPVSPSGTPIEEDAKRFVRPSPTLEPYQRIELYNQQYWWRLLSTLHDIFPLVTRLFGYTDFNQKIGFPYLETYPPHHWSLNALGDHLPEWIEKHYHVDDKILILDAAKVDRAFNDSFVTEMLPPLNLSQLPNPEDISSILPLKLCLQPAITLFKMPYDLFRFRIEMVKKGGDDWIDCDFPPLEKDKEYTFVLFRNHRNDIAWEEISKTEFELLSLFQKGISIEDACFELEQQDGDTYREAIAHLAEWFQKWTRRSFLSLQAASSD